MNWSTWKPSEAQPWNVARVAHLYRRSGFSPDWETIQRALKQGADKTIDECLGNVGANTPNQAAFEQMSATISDAAIGAGSADRLRAWWAWRMLMTPQPLIERMTLLWHNHFATSNEKVRDVSAMFEQNQLFRQHAMGSFGDLLRSVVKHRALLVWLDANTNRKEHPNENLARELMELFTLGEGNYSETDVKEASRCLTGWTVQSGKFRFVDLHHDRGNKKVLEQSGPFDGDALLSLLIKHPATSRRLAWRLCDIFLGEDVASTKQLEELADGLRERDLDIAWAVERILRSELFFSESNIRSRVMSPVEFVIGTSRALELAQRPPSSWLLAAELRAMGQDLFYPPNVFGWTEGREWIHTRSVIARRQFVQRLIRGELHQSPSEAIDPCNLASRHGFQRDRNDTMRFCQQLIGSGRETSRDNPFLDQKTDLTEAVIELFAAPEHQLA